MELQRSVEALGVPDETDHVGVERTVRPCLEERVSENAV